MIPVFLWERLQLFVQFSIDIHMYKKDSGDILKVRIMARNVLLHLWVFYYIKTTATKKNTDYVEETPLLILW